MEFENQALSNEENREILSKMIDEIAMHLHHRLVSIHPFPNGNGRHARMFTDILIEMDGSPVSAEQLNELSSLLPDTVNSTVSLMLISNGTEIELELITDYLVPMQRERN